MADRLCPKCGHFALRFTPGINGQHDTYVCSVCGEVVPIEEANVSLDENSMQRFPSGKDAVPESNLSGFLKGKKQ